MVHNQSQLVNALITVIHLVNMGIPSKPRQIFFEHFLVLSPHNKSIVVGHVSIILWMTRV